DSLNDRPGLRAAGPDARAAKGRGSRPPAAARLARPQAVPRASPAGPRAARAGRGALVRARLERRARLPAPVAALVAALARAGPAATDGPRRPGLPPGRPRGCRAAAVDRSGDEPVAPARALARSIGLPGRLGFP